MMYIELPNGKTVTVPRQIESQGGEVIEAWLAKEIAKLDNKAKK